MEFSAKFHAYSPNNVMLLHVQHARAFEEGRVDTPTPTFVAGQRAWQELSRQVDKGQKGYAIPALCSTNLGWLLTLSEPPGHSARERKA